MNREMSVDKCLSNGVTEPVATVKLEFKAPQLGDDLILYFHPYNFYSQKVNIRNHVMRVSCSDFIIVCRFC